jgi:hypothetical protein
MAKPAPTSGPTSARVRFEVFTEEGRAFLRPGEDPIVLLPSPDRQEKEPLRDAWLYLFTWRLSKQTKRKHPSEGTPRHPKEVPTLAFEIYADHDGHYHSPQRLDGPGQQHMTLTLDDSTASKAATDVYYGCWISPFRVPKKHLPACAATGQASDPEAMWKWLGDRGVLGNAFRWDELSRDSNQRGSSYTAVARSPLRRALQLADDAVQEGAKDLKRFSRMPQVLNVMLLALVRRARSRAVLLVSPPARAARVASAPALVKSATPFMPARQPATRTILVATAWAPATPPARARARKAKPVRPSLAVARAARLARPTATAATPRARGCARLATSLAPLVPARRSHREIRMEPGHRVEPTRRVAGPARASPMEPARTRPRTAARGPFAALEAPLAKPPVPMAHALRQPQ